VIDHLQEGIYGNTHKWAKKYMKTMERERDPLTRQSRPQHGPKCPTMNPRSGDPKPSPNPSRAVGAGPGKMDAQDASALRFGPSTRPQKANKKIYVIAKDGPEGAEPGCGRALLRRR
jgi:hypothetical protein